MGSSAIEWTDATKTCAGCRTAKPRDAFAKDSSRPDGLTYWCRECRNARSRGRYEPKPGPPRGRQYVAARDGDIRQARRRVNYLVESGLIPNPNDLPCADCGRVGNGARHEYDHHRGYAAEHHEEVEPVCAPCHHRREVGRRG